MWKIGRKSVKLHLAQDLIINIFLVSDRINSELILTWKHFN